MKKIIKFILMTLAVASVILFSAISVLADENDESTEFFLDDDRQVVFLKTGMENYNGSLGYAMIPLGYTVRLSTALGSETVLVESGREAGREKSMSYSNIVLEFEQEHGDYGKSIASDFFYGQGGTMYVNTIATLWQQGDIYDHGVYGAFRIQCAGKWGFVQAKWNDSASVEDPQLSVAYDSRWWDQMKVMPAKFWDWGSKAYCWSYYSNYFNRYKTPVYTIDPDPFTAAALRYANAPNICDTWQQMALMSEFTERAFRSCRDYYERALWRGPKVQEPVNYYIDSIQANDNVTGDFLKVTVRWKNAHRNRGIQHIPVKVSLSGGETYEEVLAFDTDNRSGFESTYYLEIGERGDQMLSIELNGGLDGEHVVEESTYDDNIGSKQVHIGTESDYGVPWIVIKNENGDPVGWAESNTALEDSNVEVAVPWQNKTAMAASNIKAEILLDGEVVYTEYMDFGPYEDRSKKYLINVGWGLEDRTIEARLNWDRRESELDPNDNAAHEIIKRRELLDFSAHDLTVDPPMCSDNRQISATAVFDNWNAFRAYNHVPVEFLYDGRVVKTEYVNFPAYGTVTVKSYFSSGSMSGTREVFARINWLKRYDELDPNNNESNEGCVTVNRKKNALIEFVEPNAPYRADTDVVSTFRIHNGAGVNITPAEGCIINMSVGYKSNANGQWKTVDVSGKTSVIPNNGSNLVYFKWHVPSDVSGQVSLSADVRYEVQRYNARYDYYYTDSFYDDVALTREVIAAPYSNTPNPEFSLEAPYGWLSNSDPPARGDTDALSWEEWTYSRGRFLKNTHRIALDADRGFVTPDLTSTAEESGSGWRVKSGYGININLKPQIAGNYTDSQVTSVQRAKASFPEFGYNDNTPGKYRTLEWNDQVFVLEHNLNAEDQGRKHFIPMWFSDGSYKVQASIYDLWCPAGMLSYCTSDSSIEIKGSMYDDWYSNR